MLIYIPVPFTLTMSNLSSPMTQQLAPYQYQQHHHQPHHHQQNPQNQQAPPPQQSTPHQHPLTTVSLSRNSTSIMCAAPTQTPHHSHHHQHHHITVAHHQTSQLNGGGYVGAATGYASPPGGYAAVPRLHHCNAHSFLCSNPGFHQYQVSGGCIGHPPNYVTPFVAAGHATPMLSHSASASLLPAASHPQLYTQPAVSIGQPSVQPLGPTAPPSISAPTHGIPHPQMPHPHHHHHHHHQHHQQPTLVSPFPAHTHIHQLPPPPHQVPTSAGPRSSGMEVLSRGLYRNASQNHVVGRVRRGGTLPGMGGNRRSGNTWRGANIQPVSPPTLPPPPPLPTTAAAAAAYPGILLHFLAMLSHPSLHQYNSVEPVVAPEAPDTENYEALLHLAERLGEAKPRGLIKTAIDQLPSYRYTGETCDTKQTTCVICMCEFELRQMLRVLPCLHEFHTKCVDKWLKSNRTCPICRGDASEYLKETPMTE